MSTFTIDLQHFGKKTADEASKICRKIGLDLHKRIVERTPVDTGRLKAGNHISLNAQPSGESGPGESGIDGFKLGDTIIVYNNVEYVQPIEFGHSKQAPDGMFRVSLNEIATQFSQ